MDFDDCVNVRQLFVHLFEASGHVTRKPLVNFFAQFAEIETLTEQLAHFPEAAAVDVD